MPVPGLVALLGLPVAAGARHVRRIAGPADAIEWREHGRGVLAELRGAVGAGRGARQGVAAGALSEAPGVRAAATDGALALTLALTLTLP